MKKIHQTIIKFPEIRLATRDAHKLRGFFGNLFRKQSPLLHNHMESGALIYRYPLVQYKVIDGIPTLMGLNEGADLLAQLFLKIRSLDLDGKCYPVLEKNIQSRILPIGLADDLHSYRFETLWMALNQQNFAAFVHESVEHRLRHLKAILVGNILSFFKAMDYRAQSAVLAKLHIKAFKEAFFKNNAMLAFEAEFTTNSVLPDIIGLGKQTARGFGTIVAAI
jgi:hypothetical protein